jgi:hypothetical protein
MKNYQLPAGTILYHGTSVPQMFDVPTGPAWFTTEPNRAKAWSIWGGDRGDRRILEYSVHVGVNLLDIRRRNDWVALCEEWGRSEGDNYGLAKELRRQGSTGWIGENQEIMLTAPEVYLRLRQSIKVPRNWPNS